MSAETDLKDVMYTWFSEETGLTGVDTNGVSKIVWDEEGPVDGDNPRPELPYGLLQVIADDGDYAGKGSRILPDVANGSYLVTYLSYRILTLSTRIVGVDSMSILRKAVDSMMSPSSRSKLKRRQTSTVVIDNILDSTVYVIVVDGVVISVNSGVGATDISIRDALVLAINSNAYLSVAASGDSQPDDTLVIFHIPGKGFDISVDVALMSESTEGAVYLSYIRTAGPRNITGLLETSYEGMAQADMFFHNAIRVTKVEDFMDTVEIQNLMNGNTITVP